MTSAKRRELINALRLLELWASNQLTKQRRPLPPVIMQARMVLDSIEEGNRA